MRRGKPPIGRGDVRATASQFAHGLSAAPLVKRYARWYGAHPRDKVPSMESVSAEVMRVRGGGHTDPLSPVGSEGVRREYVSQFSFPTEIVSASKPDHRRD